jgi:hypothetical protein
VPEIAPEQDILVVDTVTKLSGEHAGKVLVGASHCGVYAVYLAAKAQVRALVLSNAGVGLDQAGIGGLAWAEQFDLPVAAADHMSCRIADGADVMANGVISHVNNPAAALGCKSGMTVSVCAELMQAAPDTTRLIPGYGEARFFIDQSVDQPAIIGCDSISLLLPEDEGRIAITASHGAMIAGLEADGAVDMALAGVTFSDAGIGKDEAGVARLAILDRRAIPAATVDAMTAHIGDARSNWETGLLSRVNNTAKSRGATAGITTQSFAQILRG